MGKIKIIGSPGAINHDCLVKDLTLKLIEDQKQNINSVYFAFNGDDYIKGTITTKIEFKSGIDVFIILAIKDQSISSLIFWIETVINSKLQNSKS